MNRQTALVLSVGMSTLSLLGCGYSKSAQGDDAGRAAGGSNTDGGMSSEGSPTTDSDAGAGGGAGAAGSTVGGTAGSTPVGGGLSAGGAVVGGTPASGGTSKDGTPFGGRGGSVFGGSTQAGGSSSPGGAATSGGAFLTGGATTGGTVAGGTASSTVGATGGAKGTVTLPPRFVGNIDTQGGIRKDFPTYWDQFTPENAGKWMSVQGESGEKFNWSTLDALYATCEERNILFKEHSFLWGASQPTWMNRLDTSTGPAAVKTWMKTFCDRYPKTRLIDVVKEPPPHTTPRYVDAIGGGNGTTWDWIANAFKWAREACPNAVLILNDYDNLEQDASVQNTIDIVKAIQKLGAPIDAIGCETHSADKLPASTLKANIDKLVAATGLPIYITEYDIGLSNDEEQRAQYQDHFTMFWDNPSVKGVTVWGYILGATWRNNTGLMSSDGGMRLAMTWLMDFLKR